MSDPTLDGPNVTIIVTLEHPIDPDSPHCGSETCGCPSENQIRDAIRRTDR